MGVITGDYMTSTLSAESIVQKAEIFFGVGDVGAGSCYLLLASYIAPETADSYKELYQRYTPALRRYSILLGLARIESIKARTRAYAPYSGFAVGAALLAADGTVWKGCNVESGSYGLTICAERAGLVSAVAGGKRQFHAVVVATGAASPTPPCGACRQLLYEFAPEALVVMLSTKGEERWTTMDRLLPDAFSAHSLV